jgi:TetR/AcrR family transcriptional repressor of lmrAB and yxaGH operons
MTTKETLVQKTAQLLKEKGFFGTGLSQILQETNIPKGSLYHYFPMGKTALVCEALEYHAQLQLKRFQDKMRGRDTIKALEGIISIMEDDLVHSGFKYGCPLANLSMEMNEENDTIRHTCRKLYTEWEKGLSEFLQKREISNASEKSKLFFVMIEGALIMAKTNRSPVYFNIIRNQLKMFINS